MLTNLVSLHVQLVNITTTELVLLVLILVKLVPAPEIIVNLALMNTSSCPPKILVINLVHKDTSTTLSPETVLIVMLLV